jgi:hypothetical protein
MRPGSRRRPGRFAFGAGVVAELATLVESPPSRSGVPCAALVPVRSSCKAIGHAVIVPLACRVSYAPGQSTIGASIASFGAGRAHDGTPISILSLQNPIQNKRAAGRKQDLLDLEQHEAAERKRR